MHFELFETLSCKLLYLSQRSQIDATSMFSSLPVNTIVSPWPHSTASEPKVRILGFNFSLNPLRFSLIRETDTKMGTYLVPKPKSRAIGKINNNWIDAKYHQMAFRLARWCCSQVYFGESWSSKSDANVEDSDCTVWMLLFFSIVKPCQGSGTKEDFKILGCTIGLSCVP